MQDTLIKSVWIRILVCIIIGATMGYIWENTGLEILRWEFFAMVFLGFLGGSLS